MKKIQLTSSNLRQSIVADTGSYFIIEDDIALPEGTFKFPTGSILDFRGGSFISSSRSGKETTIDLNGSNVYAPPCCLFGKYVNVTGFSNSSIKAEWFRADGLEEHESINKSLVAAAGVPVVLEARQYILKGSIVFPKLANEHFTTQTLVSPGTLTASTEQPAICINVLNVRVVANIINKLSSTTYFGTGIRLSGNAYNIDIDVFRFSYLEKGIEVLPESINSDSFSGIQYCTIKFKNIIAKYCFYVDVYSKNSDNNNLHTWFTESRIEGGRMEGENGIYFVDPPKVFENTQPMDGLLFENIGFEGLTGMPIRLRNLSSSRFDNLRLSENLPGLPNNEGGKWDSSAKWIDLKNVSYVKISLKGLFDPMRVKAEERTQNVFVNAFLIDDFNAFTSHFDTLAIMPLYDNSASASSMPQMTATSTLQPFNMTKTFVADAKPSIGYATKILSLRDILPLNDKISTESNGIQKIAKFNVLPRTLNVIVKDDNIIELDVTGLSRFAPCTIDVYGMIEPGGNLAFKTSGNPSKITYLSNGIIYPASNYASFNELGLYRLTFDSDWNLVITKVTL